MRFRSLFAVLGLTALALFAAPATASADPSGPYVAGTRCGALDLSQGTTPTVLTSASLKDCTSVADTAAALAASLRFSECIVRNSHGSQSLTVTIGSVGASAATTNRINVPAGYTISLPLYGIYPTSLSIDASGAATTGQIVCFLVTR